MTTISAPLLLISLADVARLAQVKRPVVSMWRSRSAKSGSPFPKPIERRGGEELFDIEEVVTWLELTGRDSRSEVRAEVATFANLAGVSSLVGEKLFDGLTALLTVKAVTGEQLGGLDAEALLDLANDADPNDTFLRREVAALREDRAALAVHADALSDAAFSPAEAFERLMRDRFRLHLPGHTAVALSEQALSLVAEVARALALDAGIRPALFVDPTCGGSDLIIATARLHDDDSAPGVMTSSEDVQVCRLVRRRLRVHDIHNEDLDIRDEGAFDLSVPAVHVAQLPAPGSHSMTPEAMLSAIDNIAVQMDDTQRAVVIAPAAALSDGLVDRACQDLRDSILRLGRIRAVVRLPKGLVIASPRQQLTMWVLGPSHASVSMEDRRMMLADLSNSPLTADVIDDLVTDVVASMGDVATGRSHAFRFARMVNTRMVLANRGDLLEMAPGVERSSSGTAAEVAWRVERLKGHIRSGRVVGDLEFDIEPNLGVDNLTTTDHITVGAALTAGSLHLIAGNRVSPEDLQAGSGARVFGLAELTGASTVGARRVDPMRFAAAYDAGRYTDPGDVVFCTSPHIAAMVDDHGGSVVVSPARVLRVDRKKLQGLLPPVLAADINRAAPQAKQWRAWRLRRVLVSQSAALDETLKVIEAQRVAALDLVSQLEELAALVTAGVTDTILTISTTTTNTSTGNRDAHRPREEGRLSASEE